MVDHPVFAPPEDPADRYERLTDELTAWAQFADGMTPPSCEGRR